MLKAVTLGNKEYFDMKHSSRISYRDDSLWGGDTPYITPYDMHQERIKLVAKIVQTSRRTLNDKGVSVLGSNIIPPQSIIVCRRGFFPQIGKVAINELPCGIFNSFALAHLILETIASVFSSSMDIYVY